MNTIIRHLTIRGRVQGIGYRASMTRKALRLGLTGWVRNRLDGSVEAVVAGNEPTVQQFIAWAHRGPADAHVVAVEVMPAQGEYEGFEQRPTA